MWRNHHSFSLALLSDCGSASAEIASGVQPTSLFRKLITLRAAIHRPAFLQFLRNASSSDNGGNPSSFRLKNVYYHYASSLLSSIPTFLLERFAQLINIAMERREPFLNSKNLAANEGRLNHSVPQRLAPDRGTRPAPFPFILPFIPTRPRSAPPGSFTTHSLKKGSSFFYTSQRPSNLLRFAPPRSNDDSITAYDEAANELMAKPWSCSTFSEGILEQDIPDECKSEPPVRYHQSSESRTKWPYSLDTTSMSPSKFPEDKQAPAFADTPAMFVLSMFQNGPEPWSEYSPRVCDFRLHCVNVTS